MSDSDCLGSLRAPTAINLWMVNARPENSFYTEETPLGESNRMVYILSKKLRLSLCSADTVF